MHVFDRRFLITPILDFYRVSGLELLWEPDEFSRTRKRELFIVDYDDRILYGFSTDHPRYVGMSDEKTLLSFYPVRIGGEAEVIETSIKTNFDYHRLNKKFGLEELTVQMSITRSELCFSVEQIAAFMDKLHTIHTLAEV